MNRFLLNLIALFVVASPAIAGFSSADLDKLAKVSLKGCSSYSRKTPHSPGAQAMYLGYDEKGTVVTAVVAKTVKSWSKMMVVMTVRLKDGKYVVENIDLPDIAKRIKKSKHRAKGPLAVKATVGKTVPIDAVSGATKYSKKLYAEFDGMAEMAIKEIAAKPSWKKIKLN